LFKEGFVKQLFDLAAAFTANAAYAQALIQLPARALAICDSGFNLLIGDGFTYTNVHREGSNKNHLYK
jgi:hypothetical protein